MSHESHAEGGGPPPFRWLGHGTVLVGDALRAVVDPWRWRLDEPCAHLGLVTHGHGDHLAEDDLAAALRPDAPLVVPRALVARVRRTFGERVVGVAEGDEIALAGFSVTALPAEGPRRGGRPSGFHPRGAGLAYLLGSAEGRYLALGDSLPLPEHAGLAPDVAFVAVGGLVTATPEEAADAVAVLGARLVVPVHWGDLEARHPAARRFVALCAERGVRAAVAVPGSGSATRSR